MNTVREFGGMLRCRRLLHKKSCDKRGNAYGCRKGAAIGGSEVAGVDASGAGVGGISSIGDGPVTDGAGLAWMLGLPVAGVANDLTLKLACENSHSQTLFEKTYSATPYHVWIDMYYLEPNINYPNRTRQIYGEFVQDLVASGKCVGASASQALNSYAPAFAQAPSRSFAALADSAPR